jgi:hypothetical protein
MITEAIEISQLRSQARARMATSSMKVECIVWCVCRRLIQKRSAIPVSLSLKLFPTHKPTGITVSVREERSQEQNRERAMEILRGKLYAKAEAERKDLSESMQISKTTDIEWGNQIRNYVLHPYKLVKDLRTGVESSNPDAVLDGELEEFIEAEKNI